jgi:hypothetical protein
VHLRDRADRFRAERDIELLREQHRRERDFLAVVDNLKPAREERPIAPPRASISRTICPLATPPIAGSPLI